ncbi:ATP-binding cassette domain-containing protein [Candidatus Poseidoniales archaeon]|nr:ATP-binding cassette domain-containing protein [Candidatus Poseidoniales archaeon]
MKVLELSNVELIYPQSRYEAKKKMRPSKIGPISIDFFDSEVVGIIGKNGSGKSTLLRIAGGVYPPDKGNIRLRGSISMLAGVGVGFNKHLTGLENTYLYAALMGWNKSDVESHLEEIINFSELDHHFHRPIRTYSSGMKARLGISVATAFQPDILLVDEVLGVGDASFRKKSEKRVRKMIEGSGTVIIVSHSQGFMMEICDRIILMNDGEVIGIGEPKEMYTKYNEILGINSS